MNQLRITIRCQDHPEKHAKVLRIDPVLGIAWAIQLAGLLDGSSAMYIHKPGPDSPIGKCATCGGHLKCEVEEFEDAKSE